MKKKIIIYLSIVFISFNSFMIISTITYSVHALNLLNMFNLIQCKSIITVSLFIYGIFQVPWGIISERYGRKVILVITQIIIILSLFICLFSDCFSIFLIGTIILFSATSACAVLARAPAVDSFQKHEMVIPMAIMSITAVLTPIFFLIYTHYLFLYFNYTSLIITAIIINLIFLFFYLQFFKETLPKVKYITLGDIYKELLILCTSRKFLINLGLFAIIGGLTYSILFTFSITLEEKFKLNLVRTNIFLAILILSFIAGSFISRLLAHAVEKYIIFSGFIVIFATLLLYVLGLLEIDFIFSLAIFCTLISFSGGIILALINANLGIAFKNHNRLIPGLTSGSRAIVISITMPILINSDAKELVVLSTCFALAVLIILILHFLPFIHNKHSVIKLIL